MGLMEQAKLDIELITGDANEFGTSITLVAPTSETVTVVAIVSDHSNTYDAEGQPISGKFTHCSVSEQPLIDAGYPTRNADNLIAMTGHRVTITYADGIIKTYIVDDVRPDYTINLITLIMSDYAVN